MVRRPSKPTADLRDAVEPLLQTQANSTCQAVTPSPMPSRIDPCLALLISKPPKGRDWAFKVKWDGNRLAVHIGAAGVKILTCDGHDWTDRFHPSSPRPQPALEDRHPRWRGRDARREVRSDFGMQQRALGRRPAAHEPGEILLYTFDLIYLDGRGLGRLPHRERRRLLEPLLEGRGGAIRLSEEFDADGETFFRLGCELGLEGKRRTGHHNLHSPWAALDHSSMFV
jgi:bifunctional non-homologous end joining protein LigD